MSTYDRSNKAVLRRPVEPEQFTSVRFTDRLDEIGAPPSIGTVADWDNAAAEAFFGTLKRELANRRSWATWADARRDLIRWIEGWLNTRRLHSAINYCSPIEHENLYYRRGDNLAA